MIPLDAVTVNRTAALLAGGQAGGKKLELRPPPEIPDGYASDDDPEDGSFAWA